MNKITMTICMIALACQTACCQPAEPAPDAAGLEQAQASFVKQNNYQGAIDFLAATAKKNKTLAPLAAYYTGLTRYQQMKYLEETQSWDEYFSRGNEYRQEITDNLEKAVKAFANTDPVHLYSRLVLWQFHKDQQDAFHEQALADLMSAATAFVRDAKDILPVKAVADRLLGYDERAKAKELYRLYGDKLISSELSDTELQNTAMSFYKQNNVELAQALYTVYIDRLAKSASPDKAKLELIDIAKLFSYKKTGAYDLDYAEKVFAKIEQLYTGRAFDEELAYQRAYNVEKNRDFMRAKQLYGAFAASYQQSARYDEAVFKTGLIELYVARDIKAAQAIFAAVAGRPSVSPQMIASLYQLGLVAQWQGEDPQAIGFYAKLVEKAQDGFKETVAMAKARMMEIEESRPLEFNIKSLLDVTLKPENGMFAMSRVDIRASAYTVAPGEELTFTSSATPPESGCMQVQLQYFWAGDIGKGAPSYQESAFVTSYADPGTKCIGLVVTTPAGVVDRSIEFVDVQ